jgi:hypothetical protein
MTRYAIAGLVLLVLGVLVVGGWWQPHAPDQPERQPLLTQRPNTDLQLGAHRAASGADVITLDNLDVFRQWKASTNPAVDQPE